MARKKEMERQGLATDIFIELKRRNRCLWIALMVSGALNIALAVAVFFR